MPTFDRMFSRRSFVVAGSAALLGLAQRAVEPSCALGDEGAELLTWSCQGASVKYPGHWQIAEADRRSVTFALDPADEMTRVTVDVTSYEQPVDGKALLELKAQEVAQNLQSPNGGMLTRVLLHQVDEPMPGIHAVAIPFYLDIVGGQEESLQGFILLKTDGVTLVTCGFITRSRQWNDYGDDAVFTVLPDFVEIDPSARWATTHFAMSGVEDAGAGSVALYNAGGVVGEGEPLVEGGALYSSVQVGLALDGFDAGPIGVYVDGRIAATYSIPATETFHAALALDSGSLLPGTHTVEVARLEGEDVAVYKKIRYTAA